MSLPYNVASRFALIFPYLTITDFFVREGDNETVFVLDGIYKEFAALSAEDKVYYQQAREKHLKTAMPGWNLHRLNFMSDGVVKITYKRKTAI